MESTLNLTLDDLRAEVGSFLGWTRTAAMWTADKLVEINAQVSSALRKFYFGAKVGMDEPIHNWTFLKPVSTVGITSGVNTAALPDDFGGFEGMVTVVRSGSSGGFAPVKIVHEEMLRAQYAAAANISGRPAMVAESQIKGTGLTKSNRVQLFVYPVPDADYTFSVPYYILPNFLTTENPYPYGGAAHAETMKAACRASAELYLDNAPGSESANYLQCLAASISYDRRHQPKSLGQNFDSSDCLAYRSGRWPDGLWHPLGIGYLGTASY